MGDYISREAVLLKIEKKVEKSKTGTEIGYWNALRDFVKKQPAADVVEVVRCQDCKNGRYDMGTGGYVCGGTAHTGEFYCMYGTKKDSTDLRPGGDKP